MVRVSGTSILWGTGVTDYPASASQASRSRDAPATLAGDEVRFAHQVAYARAHIATAQRQQDTDAPKHHLPAKRNTTANMHTHKRYNKSN